MNTYTKESITAAYKAKCKASDKDFEVMIGQAVYNAFAYCQDENLDMNDDSIFLPMYGASLEGMIEQWKMDQE